MHRTSPPALREQILRRTGCRFVIDSQEAEPLARTGATPPDRPELDGAALIVFTSGSTGAPKGVVVGHGQFAAKIDRIDRVLGFGAGERTLLVLNTTFSFGMWVALLTLLRGGTLVMHQGFDADAFVDELGRSRITRVGMVPTMMRVLFRGDEHTARLRAISEQGDLRQLMMGGEALSLALATRIREVLRSPDLIDIYGLTETATCDFFAMPEDFASSPDRSADRLRTSRIASRTRTTTASASCSCAARS